MDKKSVLFPHSWCYNTPTSIPAPTFWDEKPPFGTLCGEFASPAGVRCTQFLSLHLEVFSHSQASPFYSLLTCHVKHIPKGFDSTFSIVPSGRPLFLLIWTSKDSSVAAGQDFQLMSSLETKADGGSSGVSTARPLRNPLSRLPDLAWLGPEA